MDAGVRDYIEAISPENRPLFDRLQRLIFEEYPKAAAVISYQIPTYKVGRERLFLGAWRHGLSIYGWSEGDDAGFTARHPELRAGRGTIRLGPQDASGVSDDELRDLIRAALGPGRSI
jgi:uncharacterized protein YdhG (YjbR/CyaY superfamily)